MATTKRERQKAARREKLERLERERRRKKGVRRGVIIAIVAVVVIGTAALLFSGGSSPSSNSSTTTTVSPAQAQSAADKLAVAAGCPASTSTVVNHDHWKSAPAMTISTTGTYYAHFHTTAGDFVVHLLPQQAPLTVNNFVFLAQHKYYNCVIFHRVIQDFVVQGGDPTGTGTGGPGYQFKDELPPKGNPTYPIFSVAMANSGANTNGSQFFIVTGPQGETLPNSYSLFGQVVSGQKTLKTINNYGSNPSSQTGTPSVIERMLTVTISSQP
jgi:cyclophilin family peptidyl-prolyl cis-trans isomerase